MENNLEDAAVGGDGAESALGAPPGAIAPLERITSDKALQMRTLKTPGPKRCSIIVKSSLYFPISRTGQVPDPKPIPIDWAPGAQCNGAIHFMGTWLDCMLVRSHPQLT